MGWGLSPSGLWSLPSLSPLSHSLSIKCIVDEVLEGGLAPLPGIALYSGPGAGRYPLGGGAGTISALHGRLGRGCGPELTLIAK